MCLLCEREGEIAVLLSEAEATAEVEKGSHSFIYSANLRS